MVSIRRRAERDSSPTNETETQLPVYRQLPLPIGHIRIPGRPKVSLRMAHESKANAG